MFCKLKSRIVLFLIYSSSICFGQSKAIQNKDSEKVVIIKFFNSKLNGWGYDIFRNDKLLIHQPHIPAISGNKGFKTKHDAEKVAILLKQKIEKNIMPPTVEIRELDSLKIKY